MTHRIALVTNQLCLVGGLPTMTGFLYRVLAESSRYQPEIISIATSASDSSSVLLRSPKTWRRGVQIDTLAWRNKRQVHVGAWMSELEFQRYRPRKKLTTLLESYDLVQFVVGSPAWACVARDVKRPVLIWVATTARPDRASRIRHASLGRQVWSAIMLPLTQHYERSALRKADAVFALSQYTRASIEPFVSSKQLILAPCGVDTSLFYPGTSPRQGYILSTARFSDARKNIGLLLNAYAKLCSRMSEVPDLYLVGDLPSTRSQLLLQELRIAKKVHLLGEKDSSELAQLYRDAIFFVLPSDEEGLGIVVLEAMASGLPVISTDCGGPATAVVNGETGFLTPVGNVESLTVAMQQLLDDWQLRERMGQTGRQVAEERFSLAATGEIFLDKYDELLLGRKYYQSFMPEHQQVG